MRGKVGKETPKKEMENRRSSMTLHMTLSSAFISIHIIKTAQRVLEVSSFPLMYKYIKSSEPHIITTEQTAKIKLHFCGKVWTPQVCTNQSGLNSIKVSTTEKK